MRFRWSKLVVGVGLSASLLVVGGCGKGDPSPSASPTPGSTPSAASPAPSDTASPKPSKTPKPIKVSTNLSKLQVSGGFGKPPKVKIPAPWAIDKTTTQVLHANPKGPKVGPGASVEVNYAGYNARTGKKFDDSFGRKQTATFSLAQVVPGFAKGLEGQHQGSRVVVAMPGPDGYDGSGGNPQIDVKVGDTLVFVVDLVAVPLSGPKGKPQPAKPGLPTVTDNGGKAVITVPKSAAPTSLQAEVLIAGTGKKVTAADTITANYNWVRWSDGSVLETSYGRKPVDIPLANMVPGMIKGLIGKRVGSRVLLVIPPPDSYPDGNPTPSLSPKETTVMVVDLLFTSQQG